MSQEHFTMVRGGQIEIGQEVEITEFQTNMNFAYIIEPAVAMSGCYPARERIQSRKGVIKDISETLMGFDVIAEFEK